MECEIDDQVDMSGMEGKGEILLNILFDGRDEELEENGFFDPSQEKDKNSEGKEEGRLNVQEKEKDKSLFGQHNSLEQESERALAAKNGLRGTVSEDNNKTELETDMTLPSSDDAPYQDKALLGSERTEKAENFERLVTRNGSNFPDDEEMDIEETVLVDVESFEPGEDEEIIEEIIEKVMSGNRLSDNQIVKGRKSKRHSKAGADVVFIVEELYKVDDEESGKQVEDFLLRGFEEREKKRKKKEEKKRRKHRENKLKREKERAKKQEAEKERKKSKQLARKDESEMPRRRGRPPKNAAKKQQTNGAAENDTEERKKGRKRQPREIKGESDESDKEDDREEKTTRETRKKRAREETEEDRTRGRKTRKIKEENDGNETIEQTRGSEREEDQIEHLADSLSGGKKARKRLRRGDKDDEDLEVDIESVSDEEKKPADRVEKETGPGTGSKDRRTSDEGDRERLKRRDKRSSDSGSERERRRKRGRRPSRDSPDDRDVKARARERRERERELERKRRREERDAREQEKEREKREKRLREKKWDALERRDVNWDREKVWNEIQDMEWEREPEKRIEEPMYIPSAPPQKRVSKFGEKLKSRLSSGLPSSADGNRTISSGSSVSEATFAPSSSSPSASHELVNSEKVEEKKETETQEKETRDRDRDRDRERERDRDRDRERDKDRERDRDRDRRNDADREKRDVYERDRDSHRDRDRNEDRDRGRHSVASSSSAVSGVSPYASASSRQPSYAHPARGASTLTGNYPYVSQQSPYASGSRVPAAQQGNYGYPPPPPPSQAYGYPGFSGAGQPKHQQQHFVPYGQPPFGVPYGLPHTAGQAGSLPLSHGNPFVAVQQAHAAAAPVSEPGTPSKKTDRANKVPTSESEQKEKKQLKLKIARHVVHYLKVYFEQKRIASKDDFKLVARNWTKKLYKRGRYDPDKIKQWVDDYFKAHPGVWQRSKKSGGGGDNPATPAEKQAVAPPQATKKEDKSSTNKNNNNNRSREDWS